MTWGSWSTGDVVVRREVLKGQPWIRFPMYVVRDDADLLVTYLAPGSTLCFPDWPFEEWEHPWRAAGHRSWSGHGKLMLHRPGDAYSVDVFWEGEGREFAGWYLNLQDPVRRHAAGFDTLDHELDFWMPASGGCRAKDVDLFEQRVAERRYSSDQAASIRRNGKQVEQMLARGRTWWDASWAEWAPPAEWGPLTL